MFKRYKIRNGLLSLVVAGLGLGRLGDRLMIQGITADEEQNENKH